MRKAILLPVLMLALLGQPALEAAAGQAPPAARGIGQTLPIPQRYGVFEEPLLAIGMPAALPPGDLRQAIEAYRVQGDPLLTAPVEDWLATHAASAWSASLYLNIGLAHKRGGDYAPARQAFGQALLGSVKAVTLRDRAVGERAVAELLDMETRLGHADAVTQLLQSPQATWGGYAAGAVSRAQADTAAMREQPEEVLRCGLIALSWLLRDQDPKSPAIVKIMRERAGKNGITLDRLEAIARSAGLPMRAVHRTVGQAVPVPSVVHWKEGHYAAVLGMQNGRYRVRDSALHDEVLMRPEVLERQSSGYFLVPQRAGQALAWQTVPAAQAARVLGSGPTNTTNPNQTGNQGLKSGSDPCPCSGMPHYAVSSILVSLNIEDQPVAYVPAKGPPVAFKLTYNQLESAQPATFSFFNLGAKWTHNWLSYVQDDPANVGANVTAYMPGGGAIVYKGYNASTGAFTPETKEQAALTRVVNGTDLQYERRMGDGSVWVYASSDGSTTFPRRFFLTRLADPQGNAVTLAYDASQRLTSLTDALGQSTTFTYGAADPLRVTGITDPFGRSATIGYDGAGRLNSLTDAIGMQSSFTYDTDSNISAMTTPYGTTSFSTTQTGRHRQLTVTDPLGGRERVEFYDIAPGIPFSESIVPNDAPVFNQWINYRNVFYWDRNAMATAEGDYSQAHIRHFLHDVYNYDINAVSGVLESEKAPLESRVWYSYPNQADGNLNSNVDKPSRIRRVLDDGTTQHTLLTYNAYGNITGRTDPAGLQTTFVYDTNLIDLLQVKEKNAAGTDVVVATYTWNAQHLPLTYTDAAGLTTTYTYNSAGQRLTATDSLGRVTTWQYDNNGRLLTVTRPDASVAASFTYDAVGRVATRTNALGYTLAYQYDNLDRVTRVTHPDGTFEATTWNRLDVATRADRAGHSVSYTYDAQRHRITETDAVGHTTTYTYYPSGQLQTQTDANGFTRTTNRDIQGRATSYAEGNEVTNYSFDSAGRQTQMTQPDNSAISYIYDGADRLSAVQDNLGNKITYTLDLKGNRTREDVTGPSSQLVQTHSRLHDAVYRLQKDMGAQNQTTQYAYDLYSNRSSATDPLGRVTSYTYDALNRLATTTQPAPAAGQAQPVISYAYNGLDQIAQVTDPRGLATSYTYDNLGRLTQQVSPDTGSTTRTYDVANNVLSSTDAKGQVTSYTYDALNRPTSLTYNQATGMQLKTVAYTYDQGTNGIGRLTTATETAADGATVLQTTQYAYDAKGRLIQETRTLAGNTTPYVTGYTYDPYTGRLLLMTYPSGRTLAYSYDALGRVSQIGSTAPAAQGGQTQMVVASVAYQPFGGVSSYTLGNNRTVTRTYDQDGRVASYTLGSSSISVGYDSASRITSLLDTINAANSNSYGYDNLDRLTSASVPATSYGYAYDLTGNRTSRTAGSATDLTTVSTTSNRINQVAGTVTRPYTYDANGSTTADGNNTYVYDARGRLAAAQNTAGTTTYQVGANGQRVRKTSQMGDTVFHYDIRGKLIAETTPGGVVKKEYLYLMDILVAVTAIQ